MKRRDLLRRLAQHRCSFLREAGNHTLDDVWRAGVGRWATGLAPGNAVAVTEGVPGGDSVALTGLDEGEDGVAAVKGGRRARAT